MAVVLPIHFVHGHGPSVRHLRHTRSPLGVQVGVGAQGWPESIGAHGNLGGGGLQSRCEPWCGEDMPGDTTGL